MPASFFFYDLETSGFSPRAARIMQFAGQRTDLDLQPVGEPANVLIKLNSDVLPDPDAVLLTGITPQMTLQDGLTEAEFLDYFYDHVVQPETTFLGFNSIRFDDEFMRFLHYRNFYDAYEWQWANGCSRWDLLDVVRMTRALRPNGINWPFNDDGKPINRLELLTKANGLNHDHAHDALSDVSATIAVAQLIRDQQPDLFRYLLQARTKRHVQEMVMVGQPFVYTSGRYPSAHLHTTVTALMVKHPQSDSALVWDLRYDPADFVDLSVEELVACWRYNKDPNARRLPVKTLKFNRCPAIAPLGVINDAQTWQRLELTLETITQHLSSLRRHRQPLATKLLEGLKQLDMQRQQAPLTDDVGADGQLYEGFIDKSDALVSQRLRQANPADLTTLAAQLHDKRLIQLLPLYKARNFASALTSEERAAWDAHITQKLFAGDQTSQLAHYFERLAALAKTKLTTDQAYALEELQLYGQSIMPSESGQ